jgi:hypothetical protein
MRLDPATTTDADIKARFIELKAMHKKYELLPMYEQACGGAMYAVKGQNKDGMILRILGEAIGEIGEFDIDGQTMAPSTLTINRFKECPDPSTNS